MKKFLRKPCFFSGFAGSKINIKHNLNVILACPVTVRYRACPESLHRFWMRSFHSLTRMTFVFIFALSMFYVLCLPAGKAGSMFLNTANAQEILPLTVAPARQELTINPGEKSAVIIKFLNQGIEPVSGTLKVADFIVEDAEGTPTFLEGPTQLSPRFSAASWVELPYDRITIAPKDKVLIQAKIIAPQDAQPGGRYLAVFFEPGGIPSKAMGAEKEAATPVAIRIASLIYIRIAGPIEESAYVTQLKTPRFLEYGPIPVTTEILNRGNYHIKPRGTISITSVFGKKIDQQLIKEQNIFPDVTRTFKNELGQKWLFGKYKIELNASYGETGKVLTATVFTWVIPWRIMTIILLAIIVIILLISLLVHRLKRHEEILQEKIEELEHRLEDTDKITD